MPRKPATAAAGESAAPAVDPQKQYLMDQFGNLMEQVGDGLAVRCRKSWSVVLSKP